MICNQFTVLKEKSRRGCQQQHLTISELSKKDGHVFPIKNLTFFCNNLL